MALAPAVGGSLEQSQFIGFLTGLALVP